ncbi:MAG: hypothetical protein IJ859_00355 [Synergistaceae bacterium]|nr:hypothetical protein [Synergistaceae bacterium]
MATSTFDRPLVLEKDEDIKRFWDVMNSEPNPIFRNLETEEGMRRCAELFKQKVRNSHLH